jgi:hypothetical protein
MLVERMYVALTRLATVALVCGLIIVMLLTINSGQLYPPGFFSTGTGGFFGTLRFAIPQYLIVTISFLIDGTAFLGIVVAWADDRQTWMIALLAVVLVALAFPVSLNFAGSFFARHPRIGQLIGQHTTILIYLLSLVPVALTLAFARLRGGWRASVRTEADATLEITRSRL